MPYLDSNVPSNIYYAFIDPTILSFFRPISDISDFFTLSNQHLKRMQKQGIKYRSIISILKKIFGKFFQGLYRPCRKLHQTLLIALS